jgi:hypothetical protein
LAKGRSQWLATINLGYTSPMRTLTALMLFAATPVVAGDYENAALIKKTRLRHRAARPVGAAWPTALLAYKPVAP